MVKLVGNDTMEEIEAYFDYENNFPQLLEDYLYKSGEIQKQLDKSKSKDKKKFIRNQRTQLKKLYEERNTTDEDKPRIKLFKTWMSNLYEQKKMKYHKKDNDLEKDELIRNLKNELLKKDETIIQLKNENKFYLKKINKLRKQLNLDKPKPVIDSVEDNEPEPKPEPKPAPEPEPTPEPEPKPAPEPEPKIDSVYCNHLTQEEEKEKDDREQMIKAECERKAREREEHIEKKNKIENIMETYYSQCDLEIDKMEKKFKKEVKKADRTKKSIKNDYTDSLEDILLEIQEEYLENHVEFEEVSKERKLQMIRRPLEMFEDLLPSEMVQVVAIN